MSRTISRKFFYSAVFCDWLMEVHVSFVFPKHVSSRLCIIATKTEKKKKKHQENQHPKTDRTALPLLLVPYDGRFYYYALHTVVSRKPSVLRKHKYRTYHIYIFFKPFIHHGSFPPSRHGQFRNPHSYFG